MDAVIHQAKWLFEFRERVIGQSITHDPDWRRVVGDSFKAALAGERGDTDQQQCVFQAIRLELWQTGVIRATWTKAFPPPFVIAERVEAKVSPPSWTKYIQPVISWWSRVISRIRSLLKRFNGSS